VTGALVALLHVAASALVQPSVQPAAPQSVTIRSAQGPISTLAVESDSTGAQYVRAERLAEALRGTFGFVAGSPYHAKVQLAGATFELVADAPFVRFGEADAASLSAPTRLDGDRVLVALDLVTDVIPRVVPGFIFDAEHRQLRAFAPVATAPATPNPARRTPSPKRTLPPTVRPAPQMSTGGRRVVVVDAGHGGPDSGMHGPLRGGPVVDEKNVTLAISRKLRETLEARGVAVVLTRARDTLIALSDRGRIANQYHGELFISIHVNAANPNWRDAAGTRGFETYFLAEAKSEDARRVASLENESVQFETASPKAGNDPLGFILSDMAQNAHLRESSRFADLVQRRLARVHPSPSRGVKQAGFRVLVTASMPAILVEVGYGTNAEDAAYMLSPRGQQAMATAIADAAIEYLGRSGTGSDVVGSVP
jgi:N-acetylmuramoyl-L-alanine amidase